MLFKFINHGQLMLNSGPIPAVNLVKHGLMATGAQRRVFPGENTTVHLATAGGCRFEVRAVVQQRWVGSSMNQPH